jgi:hypothetical protein
MWSTSPKFPLPTSPKAFSTPSRLRVSATASYTLISVPLILRWLFWLLSGHRANTDQVFQVYAQDIRPPGRRTCTPQALLNRLRCTPLDPAKDANKTLQPLVNLPYNYVGNVLYISAVSYRLRCTKYRLQGRADCSNYIQARERGNLLCSAFGMVTYFREESQGVMVASLAQASVAELTFSGSNTCTRF